MNATASDSGASGSGASGSGASGSGASSSGASSSGEGLRLSELRPCSFVFECAGALEPSVCTEIVRRFEANPDQHHAGLVGQQAQLDQAVKRSTDLTLSGREDWRDLDAELLVSMGRAITAMRARYPFFRGRFKDMGYAVQRTLPGEHYHWHVDGGSHEFSHRQLVAIWYLNDVPGPGGETEFLHQAIKVRPEVGKLLLFPPFWTHEHRGVTLVEGVKYIATTWVLFA